MTLVYVIPRPQLSVFFNIFGAVLSCPRCCVVDRLLCPARVSGEVALSCSLARASSATDCDSAMLYVRAGQLLQMCRAVGDLLVMDTNGMSFV